MAGPTKKEIEKIMRDPNSPERKVYDKFLKGNPLFPDLGKKDSKEKEIEKRLIKSGNKKIKMNEGGKVKKQDNFKQYVLENQRQRQLQKIERIRGSFPKDAKEMELEMQRKDKASGYTPKKMKKGGMVKKCRMDGIALRGKTRAKERGK